ncbi:hypothetical protein FACS189487_07320 [Campylobacterota bacterium]|nr:hypothetical protein FACS189487_07320 [Campylobacterota bacterium]
MAEKGEKLKRTAAIELISYFVKNAIDCVIVGEPSSGKTAIASALCPNAPIVHAAELKMEYLAVLRSHFCAAKQVIIENIGDDGAQFLEPFLSARSIMGSRFDCSFVITARKNCNFAFVPAIEIDPIDAESYAAWAAGSGIHPAIVALIGEDAAFFRRHNPKKIEALSKTLSARPAAKTLPQLIKTFLGDDESAKDFLISMISAPIESIASAAVSTDENARAFETSFVESLKENPKKEDADRFAAYAAALAKSDRGRAFEMLFALLDSQKGSEALNAALSRVEVQNMIDESIGVP